MANIKISALPSQTAATDNDLLVIVDSGLTQTSKITKADFLSGSIPTTVFQSGTGTDSIRASYLPASEASNTRTFSVGDNNTASGAYASVVGGVNGTASGLRSAVFGGDDNNATANTSTTLGGFQNTAGGQFSITLGGRVSSITGEGGGIASADSSSWTNAPYSFGAGLNNVDYTGGGKRGNAAIGANECVLSYMEQSGIYSTHESDILGTSGNEVKRSFIMGGSGNTINNNSIDSGILGGNNNTLSASVNRVYIIGGSSNTISSTGSNNIIAGGITSTLSSNGSENGIFSGLQNQIGAGSRNTVIGGELNNISNGSASVVIAGRNGRINGGAQRSFIGGGFDNLISSTGDYVAILGGGGNTISKGTGNVIAGGNSDSISSTGSYNSVIGGSSNTISGTGSRNIIAGGISNTLSHTNAAMIASSGRTSLYDLTLHTDNIHTYKTETFNVIAGGNVGGNIDVDCSLGTIFTFSMTANTTPNFINLRTGQRFIFIVENTGSYSVPTATVNGVSSTVYAKNGALNPTNAGFTKYTATYASGILWLDEELSFQAI